jgi:CubicO group peptidase (beta-lactamase class C family)
MKHLALLLLWAGTACAAPQASFPAATALDAAIQDAIAHRQVPGAVVLVGQSDRILYEKAYGSRSLVPQRQPMTADTIFDAASLTKVLATTSSIMKLFEAGKLRLDDPVTRYLPEFEGGQTKITVRQLLTHFSSLRPDLDLRPVWSGYDTGIRKAMVEQPTATPGMRFIYSDINFILLGEIVHRLSGQTLADYSRREVFLPLGMNDTQFNPPESLRPRIAPTEVPSGSTVPLHGIVHDETARDMGGVAGHAGVFTTARDLSRFARMMLNRGELDGVRLFSPATVRLFTSPQSPPHQPILRGLGWDIDSPFSSNRGELFPLGSYGHTGFTGTSIWIDPSSQSYVILLTNSVHPHRGIAITSLRSRVATVAASAIGIRSPDVLMSS